MFAGHEADAGADQKPDDRPPGAEESCARDHAKKTDHKNIVKDGLCRFPTNGRAAATRTARVPSDRSSWV